MEFDYKDLIARLRWCISPAEMDADDQVALVPRWTVEEAADALEAQAADLERERLRLAACGVVALADTPESAQQQRVMHPDYESAACNDVARRVDECIALRARIAKLEETLREAMAQAVEYDNLVVSNLGPQHWYSIASAVLEQKYGSK